MMPVTADSPRRTPSQSPSTPLPMGVIGTDAGDGDPPADAHDALFPLVASSSRSTISLMVLSVSPATCSMNRGPMM